VPRWLLTGPWGHSDRHDDTHLSFSRCPVFSKISIVHCSTFNGKPLECDVARCPRSWFVQAGGRFSRKGAVKHDERLYLSVLTLPTHRLSRASAAASVLGSTSASEAALLSLEERNMDRAFRKYGGKCIEQRNKKERLERCFTIRQEESLRKRLQSARRQPSSSNTTGTSLFATDENVN